MKTDNSAFWNFFLANGLYVATLRSGSLIRIRLETTENDLSVSDIEQWFAEARFSGKYGRLRDVVTETDESLYVLTSNRDGPVEIRSLKMIKSSGLFYRNKGI